MDTSKQYVKRYIGKGCRWATTKDFFTDFFNRYEYDKDFRGDFDELVDCIRNFEFPIICCGKICNRFSCG